jgi:DNA-binding NtrC family response regulator
LALDELVAALLVHDIDLQFAKKQLERTYIQALLRRNQNNIGQTARALGVHRNTLSKHIRELKIVIEK